MKNNLKLYRKQANLTLQALAEMYGGTKSHCHALENGTSSPTLTTAYAICCVLDKTVYEIWPDTTEVVTETIEIRRVVAK